MPYTITQVKSHLTGQLHGGSLNKVRNVYELMERAANTLLTKIDPTETIRSVPLSNAIYDDVYNYSLPSDYKKIIDLIPQDDRELNDTAIRNTASYFDLRKEFGRKNLSIEGSGASKIIRINWRSRQGKTLHTMNDYDDNGTWTAVATASGVEQDTITKHSGSGSVRFDLAASDDGIQNTTMSAVDMTDEDEVADIFLWFYIKNSTDLANLTSATCYWGNDLTTAYWSGVAQTTQADGTAFKVGWNLIKTPWSTATETGTVAPATIDSFKITFQTSDAISDIRVDNIIFTIGRNFDIKYYSKYIFQDTSNNWISIPTTDDDSVILDNDAINIFLLECVINAAQQMEGVDSTFDINYAKIELEELYRRYKSEYPSQSKKGVNYYGSNPARGRW